MYRLVGDRLKKLVAYYAFGSSEGGVVTPHPEKVFFGPYPAPELYKAALPAACLTLTGGTSGRENRPHAREDVPGTTPPQLAITTKVLSVATRWQLDVLAATAGELWGDGESEGLCDKLMAMFAANPWLADDDGEQALRCALLGQAMNADALENTKRWHRGILEVAVDGHLLATTVATRINDVQIEI